MLSSVEHEKSFIASGQAPSAGSALFVWSFCHTASVHKF